MNILKLKLYVIPLLIGVNLLLPNVITGQELYKGAGAISFISDAPLENITASSSNLSGIIALDQSTFAFQFPVNSFDGFNSPLQKEHFNEHYLETSKFPNATFTGKIIGLNGCEINCETEVFAKGKLEIHGITKIVTIPVNFKKAEMKIIAEAEFEVALSDYNIKIPKILEAKISPLIDVIVHVQFEAQ